MKSTIFDGNRKGHYKPFALSSRAKAKRRWAYRRVNESKNFDPVHGSIQIAARFTHHERAKYSRQGF